MGMHWLWILGILAVVLIIFGPGRLPEIGTALGRGMREFRKASEELREEVGRTVDPLRQPAGRDGADQPAGAGGAAPPAEAPAPTSDSGPAAQG